MENDKQMTTEYNVVFTPSDDVDYIGFTAQFPYVDRETELEYIGG